VILTKISPSRVDHVIGPRPIQWGWRGHGDLRSHRGPGAHEPGPP